MHTQVVDWSAFLMATPPFWQLPELPPVPDVGTGALGALLLLLLPWLSWEVLALLFWFGMTTRTIGMTTAAATMNRTTIKSVMKVHSGRPQHLLRFFSGFSLMYR